MRSWALVFSLALAACAHAPRASSPPQLDAFFDYIHRSWKVLERGHAQLLAAAVDPKVPAPPAKWPIYIAADEDPGAITRTLAAEVPAADLARISVEKLPATGAPAVPGILYLPRPYVVPGGRFNEMYGWDSYFIVVGLLRDGHVDRARDMVDDFVYEVAHYGKVLNANRSYYLTRSQPPLLTPMILAVYARTHDRAWLARTLPAVEKYHRYFTEGPHQTALGLSRYFDSGRGPAPEVVAGERDAAGRSHYDRVREVFRTQKIDDYDVSAFYDAAADRLTDRFYDADRAMRESGFDPSGRFGPFNAGVLDHAPVCLNSLLYLMEKQTAEILRAVGRAAEAPAWEERARVRGARVEALLWDEAAGLYFDYDFVKQVRRPYPFATTFFPLWVGLAGEAHARRVIRNLPLFETRGGLRTSTRETGTQWDSPYGWAPLQLVAFEALRRYGAPADAERIGAAFVGVVLRGFIEHGAIFEKYDVVSGKADIAAGLRFGYTSNEIGFGWTNAAVLEIWSQLSAAGRARVAASAR